MKDGFRAGLDSVLLPATAQVGAGESVLDAGCGAGVAGLCLLARVPGVRLTGVDQEPDAIRLCTDNAARNSFADRASFIEGDVFELPALLGRDRFDNVISNPPFHDPDRERISPRIAKAAAHALQNHEPYAKALGLWVEACLAVLKTKGRLTMINRAEALPATLAALEGPAGAIEIIPLWPKAGEPARRVIVRARKGARAAAKLHPGFVLHEAGGAFTPEIDAVLRGEKPLAG
jgi:tRNA1(Val) A37 N6-methylase TrmN6